MTQKQTLDKPWPFKYSIVNGKRYTNVVKRKPVDTKTLEDALF